MAAAAATVAGTGRQLCADSQASHQWGHQNDGLPLFSSLVRIELDIWKSKMGTCNRSGAPGAYTLPSLSICPRRQAHACLQDTDGAWLQMRSAVHGTCTSDNCGVVAGQQCWQQGRQRWCTRIHKIGEAGPNRSGAAKSNHNSRSLQRRARSGIGTQVQEQHKLVLHTGKQSGLSRRERVGKEWGIILTQTNSGANTRLLRGRPLACHCPYELLEDDLPPAADGAPAGVTAAAAAAAAAAVITAAATSCILTVAAAG